MNSEEIGRRLLEISGKVMQRNRTLLLVINLIAAMVLVVVYLERLSFDTHQRTGYLMAYKKNCDELKDKIANIKLDENEERLIKTCKYLPEIESIIILKVEDEKVIREVSEILYKLNKIKNEMRAVRLESAQVAPFGVGLSVPRNDLTIIFGFLLITLYAWLAFSFKQHARIIYELTNNTENKETFSDLIEANFMFQTDEKRLASIFVKLLYFAAPISMTISLINNVFFIPTSSEFMDYLRKNILTTTIAMETGIVVVLWIIGYSISQSDKETNLVSDESED